MCSKAQRQGKSETELLALSTELFGVNSAAVGIILSSNRDKMAELTAEYENVSDIENIVVSEGPVYLKDVADISFKEKDKVFTEVFLEGPAEYVYKGSIEI